MIRHVLKERNQVADRLAKMLSVNKNYIEITIGVSRELIDFIKQDKVDDAFDHLI